ncbi:MAG: hypothetical protein RLZ35_1150 [Pseudomonadota bacterium]|jgi:flagellar protein FlgJ
MMSSGIHFSAIADSGLQTNSPMKTSTEELLNQVAQSFESLYVQLLLKSMRQANQALSSELQLTQEHDTFQSLFDQHLSTVLATTGQLRIARLIAQQLGAKLSNN